VYSKQKGKIANLTKMKLLSFGINKYTNDEDIKQGFHAEHDALDRLKPLNNRGARLDDISLLIVRFSKTGKIQNSKPCSSCIERMSVIPANKGYRLKRIYYSTNCETICATTLHELKCDEDKHKSRLSRAIDKIQRHKCNN